MFESINRLTVKRKLLKHSRLSLTLSCPTWKKEKKKCVAKNVSIFFIGKLLVANKLHKFPSASRYHGRNEVWDVPWFPSLWCFLRSVPVSFSRSCDIKMDGKKREGAKRIGEKKRTERDEAWMVLTTWKFIATGEKWWTVIHSVFERIRVSSVFSFTEEG